MSSIRTNTEPLDRLIAGIGRIGDEAVQHGLERMQARMRAASPSGQDEFPIVGKSIRGDEEEIFEEFGGRNRPPRPVMRPAFEQTLPEIYQEITELLRRAMGGG